MNSNLSAIMRSFPNSGIVEWIGLRPARREPLVVVSSVEVDLEIGLIGDRYQGKLGGLRQVTLFQYEHLAVVAAILGRANIDPGLLRRNIGVRGINLLALRSQKFRIGSAILAGTGNCAPCSRMEENFGPGGFNAMRGHGGITATVIQSGLIRMNDSVEWIDEASSVKSYDD